MHKIVIKIVHCILVFMMCFALVHPFIGVVKEVEFSDMHDCIEANRNEKYQQEDTYFIAKYYHLKKDMYKQAMVYTYGSAMEAQEIAIFYEQDKTKRKMIEEQVKARKEEKKNTFKGYQEEKYQMIQNGLVFEIGDYVCLLIDKDVNGYKHAIEELFS